jgi:drug/metabolite transporter (DMT)-like permease
MNRVEAAVASSFLFAEPLVTVLFATTFVGEEISMFTVGGSFLIFVGVYLVTRK